jgi:hypothetical protein
MMALENLNHGHFAPLVGQTFQSGDVPLTLHSAKLLGHRRPGALRAPFSLTLRGQPGLRLPQATHRLTNKTLGDLDIFITQVGDGPEGADFEAIFT